MKILIVDDVARRYERLIPILESNGVNRSHINIVSNTIDARSRLENEKYDLLILDILVPLRSETESDYNHSVDLIREMDTDAYLTPTHIVGITADIEAAKKVSSIFEEKLWCLISYSAANDSWMNQIINCVKHIIKSHSAVEQKQFQVDLAIICALRDPELNAILQLPWNFQDAEPISDSNTFIHRGTLISEGNSFSVVVAVAPRMGMVATALTTSELIESLRPRVVVMAGICGGIQSKTNFGDIVFADPVWCWEAGKHYVKDGQTGFSGSPHQLDVAPILRSCADQFRAKRELFDSISRDYTALTDKPSLKMIIGPVACSSAVIANPSVVETIKTQHRETCGIEMEVYGLFAAAQMSSRPSPLAFAMKSVCDHADGDKNDNYQHYAAYTSARALKEFVEMYGIRLFKL